MAAANPPKLSVSQRKWTVSVNQKETTFKTKGVNRLITFQFQTHMTSKTATYSSTTYTDIPFSETPGAEYFEDEARVFAAIFCGKQRSRQLNEIRWELQGLDSNKEQSHFDLGVRSSLYPDRRGSEIWLKGYLQVTITFDGPPMLAFFLENVQRRPIESMLNKVMENMNCELCGSLLADHSKFKRERQREHDYNSILTDNATWLQMIDIQ